MKANEILAHLRKDPFRAIHVYVSDGAFHEARHPELMLVSRAEVVIALDPGDVHIPERSAYCDPVHITRIEPLDGTKRKRRSRPRK